jgi:hypothetical protein
MVFNATFNNISVISWQSVLLVEEIGENLLSHLNLVLLTPHFVSIWAKARAKVDTEKMK